ncbi:hypothetical protein ACN27F_32805 [Solwaraspora sp. WMMB335]|uniref:hypothetical protein n=1 Tax=Solwaraspora sp. WMMB335 TaxID=3404118 RepID=UPI003B955D9E
MDRLRTPLFLIALGSMVLVLCLEIGSSWLLGGGDAAAGLAAQAGELGVAVPDPGQVTEPPGIAIGYLALVDVVGLFTVGLFGLGLVLPTRALGRVQGPATLVSSIILVVAALALLLVAIAKLLTMLTLLLAVPFGTIVYLIRWGFFPRGEAAVVLSTLMVLKLVFAGTLVAAQPRFIQNKGLVAITLTSLAGNLVVAFLHGLVPGILVSITDAIAGIVLAIIAIVWAVVLLVGSIPAIVKTVRSIR